MKFDKAKILESTQSVIDKLIGDLKTLQRRQQAAQKVRQKATSVINAVVLKHIKVMLAAGENYPEITNLCYEGDGFYSATIPFKFKLTRAQIKKYNAATGSDNSMDLEIRVLKRRIKYFTHYKQVIDLASGDSITVSNKNRLSYFVEDLLAEIK